MEENTSAITASGAEALPHDSEGETVPTRTADDDQTPAAVTFEVDATAQEKAAAESTPAAASSSDCSIDLELPTLPEDSLWSILSRASKPTRLDLESHQLVATGLAEWETYQTRLKEQLRTLQAKGAAEAAALQAEYTQLAQTLQKLAADVDMQIDELLSQPVRKRAEALGLSSASSTAANSSGGRSGTTRLPLTSIGTASPPPDDASKLVNFWKLKQLNVMRTLELLGEERETMQHRISDLKALQDTDQYRAFRIIGERRAEENDYREFANGYRCLLYEMSTQSPRPSSVAEKAALDAQPKDKLSAIERRIADQEAEALKDLTGLAESRLRCAKQHLNSLQRRADTLEYRVEELCAKTRDAPTATLDRTLEQALDLRSKVASLSQLPADDPAPLIEQNTSDERSLRAELDRISAEQSSSMEAMQRELRERRVKVIRAIHNSGGNVEARFDLLRAHQHVAVVNRQIAAAESERVNLKLELAQASGSASRALEFLRRTGTS